MNKRLKELMLEAGYAAPELAERAQKLAELVARECMEQVWHTREDSIDGYISDVIKERMKKHFGIKDDQTTTT